MKIQKLISIFLITIAFNVQAQNGAELGLNDSGLDTVYVSGITYDRIQTEDTIYYVLREGAKLQLDRLIQDKFINNSTQIDIYSYHHPLSLSSYSFVLLCRPVILNRSVQEYLVENGIERERIMVRTCTCYPFDEKNKHQDEVYFVVHRMDYR